MHISLESHMQTSPALAGKHALQKRQLTWLIQPAGMGPRAAKLPGRPIDRHVCLYRVVW